MLPIHSFPRRKAAVALAIALASAGLCASAGAAVINVQLSRTAGGDTTGNSTNNGIFAETYTPTQVTIPVVGSQTYDAADTTDSGTTWNSLKVPANKVSNSTGGNITTVYQQNLPLVDSGGNSTSALLDVSFTENNGKNDAISSTGLVAGTNPGTDGLSANPSGLMAQSWYDNGTSEIITFALHSLPASTDYNLYIYGAGQNVGYGGTYTVPAANQASGYNTAAGAYSTEPSATSIYRSVFDASSNPVTEQGLTWTVLPVTSDANGNLTFNVNKDAGSGIKGSINGFQLDSGGSIATPEPASLGVLAMGGLALLAHRRKA
jgi:hypothetical protein